MVNILTIALTHAIMLLAAWRIMLRHDLEHDLDVPEEPERPDREPETPARRPRKRSRLRT